MKPFLMFSSDDHAGATRPVYRQFMERRYHDDYDRWVAPRAAAYAAMVKAAKEAQGTVKKQHAEEVESDEAQIFGTELDKRLERLEREGLVGEVLYPGPAAGPRFDEWGVPFSGMFGEAEPDVPSDLHAVGHLAHNRWQAETSPDLGRQVGLALISQHDVAAAVAEIHRSAKAGLRGVLMEGVHPTLPPLDDPCYAPIWSACEAMDMAVHFHAGVATPALRRITGAGSNGKPAGMSLIGGMESQWLSHRPLWFLILGGVCERHPKLRIVFAELGGKWAPEAMAQFRWYWQLGKPTPHEPMHYYDRQVFFGASAFAREDVESRYLVGVDKLMWGGDHPHGMGAWGCTNAWLRATLGAGKVPEPEARAMLGETVVAFYGLDAARLRAIAERVGPTPDDVLRPPEPADLENPALLRNIEFTH